MPGPRQPTDLVKARGKKHFSQTEEDQHRDQEVHVQPPDRAEPPRWRVDGQGLHIRTDFRSDFPVVFRITLR